MSRQCIERLAKSCPNRLSLKQSPQSILRCFHSLPAARRVSAKPHAPFLRPFSTSRPFCKGIAEEPARAPSSSNKEYAVAELSDRQYHELSDHYMDLICSKFEELQDQREDVDVEYSAGVLSIVFPGIGTYVVNKQPPNKQIWLSSPISGPKRYDWVVLSGGQSDKEGTENGDWIYMRDQSTLSEIFLQEMKVDINEPID